MRVLKGSNLTEVLLNNDCEIHINDVIHWANKHNYHIIPNGKDFVEFDNYVVQDVSKEKGREASDAVILCFDSNAFLHSYLFLK